MAVISRLPQSVGSGGNDLIIDGEPVKVGALTLTPTLDAAQTLTDCPSSCYSGAGVFWRDNVYVIVSKKFYKYENGAWVTLPDCPLTGSYSNAVVYNDEIHVVHPTGHYKWNGETWTSASTVPALSSVGVVVVHNGNLHIMGRDNTVNAVRWHYRLDGETWTSLGTPPFNVENASYAPYSRATDYKGVLNLIAGQASSNNHYIWDDSSLTWTQMTGVPFSYGTPFVINDTFFCTSSSATASLVYYYSGESWINTKQYSQTYHSAFAVDDKNLKFYILGKYSTNLYDAFYMQDFMYKAKPIIN